MENPAPPPEDIARILGPNEKVQLYIKEKIYHPKFSIDSLVITNERIILRHPHAMALKTDFTDYSYSDIAGVSMDKGIRYHKGEHREIPGAVLDRQCQRGSCRSSSGCGPGGPTGTAGQDSG